jgi:AcrR family transcriptional regulator
MKCEFQMDISMTTEGKNTQVDESNDLATSFARGHSGRADKTRQDIIDAAGSLFAEKGFKATTISQICKAADVNQAAVNFHFGGKEQLYIDLVRYGYEYALAEIPWPKWEPGTPATVRLRDFIVTFLRRAVADREPHWPCQLIMREMIEPTKACEEFVRGYIRPSLALLQSILQDLLPADFPQERRLLVGQSIIGQMLFYRVARPVLKLVLAGNELLRFDEPQIQRLADHITAFTLAAIGAAPALNV